MQGKEKKAGEGSEKREERAEGVKGGGGME